MGLLLLIRLGLGVPVAMAIVFPVSRNTDSYEQSSERSLLNSLTKVCVGKDSSASPFATISLQKAPLLSFKAFRASTND